MAKKLIQRLEKFAEKHACDKEPNGLPQHTPIPFTIGDDQVMLLPQEAKILADAIQSEYVSRSTFTVVRDKLDRAELQLSEARVYAEEQMRDFPEDATIVDWMKAHCALWPVYNEPERTPVRMGDEMRVVHPGGDSEQGRLQAVHLNAGDIVILSFVGCDHERLVRFDPEQDQLILVEPTSYAFSAKNKRIHKRDKVVLANGKPIRRCHEPGVVHDIDDDGRSVIVEWMTNEGPVFDSRTPQELIHYLPKRTPQFSTTDAYDLKVVMGTRVHSLVPNTLGCAAEVIDITNVGNMLLRFDGDERDIDTIRASRDSIFVPDEVSVRPLATSSDGKKIAPGAKVWPVDESDPDNFATVVAPIDSNSMRIASKMPAHNGIRCMGAYTTKRPVTVNDIISEMRACSCKNDATDVRASIGEWADELETIIERKMNR